MSSTEDQLRAAGRAVSEQVDRLPELRLERARARRRPAAAPRRRWTAWAAPLTAVAVVVAVAVALVAVRNAGAGNPAAPAGQGAAGPASQLPRYYVATSLLTTAGAAAGTPSTAVIGDLRTGQAVATVTPPAGHVIDGVTGDADGGTFVIDMPPAQRLHVYQFFAYRAATAGGAPLRGSALPLSPSPNGDPLLGLALSPDGRQLAVLTFSSVPGHPRGTMIMRVYSAATGKVQRQWTMPAATYESNWNGDNGHFLSWTGDGKVLAFEPAVSFDGGKPGVPVFLLDTTRPGHDLRAGSRSVTVQATGLGCYSMLLSPDGKTVICGVKAFGSPSACPAARPGITEYSAATGKLERVLYEYPGSCPWGFTAVLWSSQDGAAVAAGLVITGRLGLSLLGSGDALYTAGRSARLPVHQPADVSAVLDGRVLVAF